MAGETVQWSDEVVMRRALVRGRFLDVAATNAGVVVSWGNMLLVGYGYTGDGRVVVTKPSKLEGAPPSQVVITPEQAEVTIVNEPIEVPGLGMLECGMVVAWAWRVYQSRAYNAMLSMPAQPPSEEGKASKPALLVH